MRFVAPALAVFLSWLPAGPDGPRSKPVSFAILEDYDKGDDLSEVERDFALFDELEIRTWRGSFGWEDYEPQPGTFDLDWLHRFAEAAGRRGLQLRPYLAHTPEWAGARGSDEEAWNNAPQWLAHWTNFAETIAGAVQRYPNVISFEIYNKQNVKQRWDSTASRYADVVTAGSRAIQDANPRARVLLGGLVFPDAPWIEEVCSAPGARNFDVLPFHAYPETRTPPGVTVENYLGGLDAFVTSADASCGRKAIWINETGFATTPGRTEREQAAWWVRAMATFLAHPRVEHIGVYEIKDRRPDRPAPGDATDYHLGLTRADRTRKLAFHTVDMLTDLLDVGSLTIADDELQIAGGDDQVYVHLFARPDGRRVLVAWAMLKPTRAGLDVGRSTRIFEYGLDGSRTGVHDLASVELNPQSPRVFLIEP